jgi:glycosyltransferase involved in cell wall biosynthesis
MSCAKYCIVTDVGASSHLVDDCGRVVAPASPPALRDAIVDAARASREALEEAGRRARARVVASFSEDRMVRDYLDVLAGIRGRPA